MKILFVINYSRYRGGEETYFNNLILLFKKTHHKVMVYTKDSQTISNNLFNKIKISKTLFIDRSFEREFEELINNFKPDIVHFNNIFPLINPICYKICKKYNIPTVQSVQSYRLICPKHFLYRDGDICEDCAGKQFKYPAIIHGCYQKSRIASLILSTSLYFHFLRKSFSYISKFVFPSIFTRDYYLKRFSIQQQQAVVIPNFSYFNTVGKQITSKKNYFLFAGRLSEEKGIMSLLNLFVKTPEIRLIVIGDGPLKKEILINHKSKNIKVINYLPQQKLFEYIKQALGVIVPSRWYEVDPLIIIESYANKTPVIIPNLGSFTYGGKKTIGVIYKYNDYEDLRKKLLFLNKNKNIAYTMGTLAYKEYIKHYTKEKHYKQILKLYSNLILSNDIRK